MSDHVRTSKYKNIFAKGYVPNWSEEVFVVSKIKNTVPWAYVINDLNNEEIRIEKVLKRKGDRLYGKWIGYGNRFNSWINKEDIV